MGVSIIHCIADVPVLYCKVFHYYFSNFIFIIFLRFNLLHKVNVFKCKQLLFCWTFTFFNAYLLACLIQRVQLHLFLIKRIFYNGNFALCNYYSVWYTYIVKHFFYIIVVIPKGTFIMHNRPHVLKRICCNKSYLNNIGNSLFIARL